MAEKKGNKKKKGSVLSTIIFIIALGVFLYAGYNLFTIGRGYLASRSEYASIENTYTKPFEAASGEGAIATDVEAQETEEKPPLAVDWAELKNVNPDIVAWLYVDAFSDIISYPVLRGPDNNFYLRRTFEHKHLTAGSIFENYENSMDFADPHTLVYGHNMLDRSMFSKLKEFANQEVVDKDPYFWILTPAGNYKYKIFAQFQTRMDSDVYTIFSTSGKEFTEWAAKMKEVSNITTDVKVEEGDFVVTLSTCASASGPMRIVVMGKCVSEKKPEKDMEARKADDERLGRTGQMAAAYTGNETSSD